MIAINAENAHPLPQGYNFNGFSPLMNTARAYRHLTIAMSE
jgi:hypothetical protein